jgi:rhamnose utilization protein RhaD (predicted bifunctional aldolase and dehydrogenase)
VNALTCTRHGERIASELFGDEVLWVPYVDPGLPLARRIAAARQAFVARTAMAAPRAMLLQNHGLIVTGDGADDVSAGCKRIVDAVRRRLAGPGPAPAGSVEAPVTKASGAPVTEASEAPVPAAVVAVLSAALRQVLANGDRPPFVLFDGSPAAREIASTTAGRALVDGGPLTPDQIVYAGSWPLWLGSIESGDPDTVVALLRTRIDAHAAATGATPSVVVAAGIGLFIAAQNERFAATARDVILDAMQVARGATRLGGVRVLAPAERHFIEDWEAEAYRRGVEAGVPPSTTAT